MLKRSLWAAALAVGLSSHVHAQQMHAQGQRMMLVDEAGRPISAANALPISGGAGGGSVTQGTNPWVISGNSTANGSGNPIFASITNLPATAVGTQAGSALTVQGNPNGIPQPMAEQGSASPTVGIAPAITQSGTSVVGKASQGNLYSAYAVNTTATAGYLACINATAAPAAGAAITPIDVQTLAGAVGATASINYGAGPPNAYSAGITCLVTTSLTTYTAGGASFIQARVR